MPALTKLLHSLGDWKGTKRLYASPSQPPTVSTATLKITSILKDQFIRMDYKWEYQGTPQEGSLLLGYVSQSETVTAHWIDTWHMQDKVMACEGDIDEQGLLSVLGSYEAPPGPDWGWRTTILPHEDSIVLNMFNISPEGHEEVAVEATFTRMS